MTLFRAALGRDVTTATLVGALLLQAAACGVLIGLGPDEFAVASDAAADGRAGTADGGVPRECRPILDKPLIAASAKEVPPFVLALSSLTFGTDQEAGGCPTAGLALDEKQTGLDPSGRNVDTCPRVADAACAPACRGGTAMADASVFASAELDNVRDYAGGVDNAFLRLRSLLLATSFQSEAGKALDPMPGLRAGKGNLLLRISNYNGEPFDDEVVVGILESSGLEDPAVLAGGPWDGKERLTWRATSTGNTTRGFVADGVLVIEDLRDFVLPLVTGLAGAQASRTRFDSGRLTGRLEVVPRQDGPADYAIVRGLLGLRLRTRELLRTVAHVPAALLVPDAGPGLVCETGDFTFRDLLCSFADLSSTGAADCDSLSVGASIRAAPALVGTVSGAVFEADTCAGAPGYDPNFDCAYLDGGSR